MSLVTESVSVVIAAGALGAAALSNRRAMRALEASLRANDLSGQANRLSQTANDVAARALALQRDRDHRLKSTSVRVEVTQEAEPVASALEPDRPIDPTDPLHHVLQIEVVNDGESAEFLVGLFVDHMLSDNDGVGYELDFPEPRDLEIRPRQRYATTLPVRDLEFDSPKMLVIGAQLASGRMAPSELFELDDDLAQRVSDHNSADA